MLRSVVLSIFSALLLLGCWTTGGDESADSSGLVSENSSSSVSESLSSSSKEGSTVGTVGSEEVTALVENFLGDLGDSNSVPVELTQALVGYQEGSVDSAELAAALTPVVDSILTIALDSLVEDDIPPFMQDLLTQLVVGAAVGCIDQVDLLDTATNPSELQCVDEDLLLLFEGMVSP